MSRKVRWGVLSTASIGVRKVLPAMQQGKFSEVVAIASRDLGKARETAAKLTSRRPLAHRAAVPVRRKTSAASRI